MKLLLTSEGFSNESIKQALYSLLNKPVEEAKIVFVTTSANASGGDKRWFIKIINQAVSINFGIIDIVDFAGLPADSYESRMKDADVLFFIGGNAYHLMYEVKKANLRPILEEIAESCVLVGNSAGAMMMTKDLSLGNPSHLNYSPSRSGEHTDETLGFVDFLIRPHVDAPGHLTAEETIKKIEEKNIKDKVYLLDNDSSLMVVNGEIEVISEGEWSVIN